MCLSRAREEGHTGQQMGGVGQLRSHWIRNGESQSRLDERVRWLQIGRGGRKAS